MKSSVTKITCLLALLVVSAGTPVTAHSWAQSFGPERELSGTVTDGQEPLKGAVVQVENESTEAVVSYTTDRNGHFDFKHLSTDADYKYWATYRGHKSRSRELSKFNDRKTPTVTLKISLK